MNNNKNIYLILTIFVASVFAGTGAKINYPEINEVQLPNGLKVMLVEHNEQPAIFYRLVIHSGRMSNPLDKAGLSQMTAAIVSESTQNMTVDELAKRLAMIGSSVSISSRYQRTVVSMNTLSDNAETAFDILADVIMNPAFRSKEFQRIKTQYISGVEMSLENNNEIASKYADFLLFGPENALGIKESVKTLSGIGIEDVKNFYQKHYRPNNATLFVIGDFSYDEMLAMIKDKTVDWASGEIAQKPKVKMDINTAGKTCVVNKPGMTQVVIYMNQWAPKSDTGDYYSYNLMNYILGGSGFGSRLMDAVRVSGGKTYGIGSWCYLNLDFGFLAISTSTRNEEFYNTYKIIKDELDKVVDFGFTEDELVKAQDYMAGAVPLKLESPGAVADNILRGKLAGFGVEDLSNEIINYRAVTLEQLNATVKKYLLPNNMNVAIVGDVEEIKSQLGKIGPYQQAYYKDELID